MDQVVTFPQLFVVAGLLLILAELIVGIQAGLDLVLIGSILFVSGFIGMFTDSVPLMLILATALSILYIAVGRNKIREKVVIVTKKTNIDKLVGSIGTVSAASRRTRPGWCASTTRTGAPRPRRSSTSATRSSSRGSKV